MSKLNIDEFFDELKLFLQCKIMNNIANNEIDMQGVLSIWMQDNFEIIERTLPV